MSKKNKLKLDMTGYRSWGRHDFQCRKCLKGNFNIDLSTSKFIMDPNYNHYFESDIVVCGYCQDEIKFTYTLYEIYQFNKHIEDSFNNIVNEVIYGIIKQNKK